MNQRELAGFERRFAGQRAAGHVRANPVFIYEGVTVALHDLTRVRAEPPERINATYAGTRSVPPASDPSLVFK